MICESVTLPGGGRAIICSKGPRKRCPCGGPAHRLCDWKVPNRKSGTCDAPICLSCTFSPAPEKDLCPSHKLAFDAWLASRSPSPPTTEVRP